MTFEKCQIVGQLDDIEWPKHKGVSIQKQTRMTSYFLLFLPLLFKFLSVDGDCVCYVFVVIFLFDV